VCESASRGGATTTSARKCRAQARAGGVIIRNSDPQIVGNLRHRLDIYELDSATNSVDQPRLPF
jgi:hypothetical protein